MRRHETGVFHYAQKLEQRVFQALLLGTVLILVLVCMSNVYISQDYLAELWEKSQEALIAQAEKRIQDMEARLTRIQYFINRTKTLVSTSDTDLINQFCSQNPYNELGDCQSNNLSGYLAYNYRQTKINYKVLFKNRQLDNSSLFFVYSPNYSLLTFLTFGTSQSLLLNNTLQAYASLKAFKKKFQAAFRWQRDYQMLWLGDTLVQCAYTIQPDDSTVSSFVCVTLQTNQLLGDPVGLINMNLHSNDIIVTGQWSGLSIHSISDLILDHLEHVLVEFGIVYSTYNSCTNLFRSSSQTNDPNYVAECKLSLVAIRKPVIIYVVRSLPLPRYTFMSKNTDTSPRIQNIGIVAYWDDDLYHAIRDQLERQEHIVGVLIHRQISVFMALYIVVRLIGRKLYYKLIEEEFVSLKRNSTDTIREMQTQRKLDMKVFGRHPPSCVEELREIFYIRTVYRWAANCIKHLDKDSLQRGIEIIGSGKQLEYSNLLQYIYKSLIVLHRSRKPGTVELSGVFQRMLPPQDVIMEDGHSVVEDPPQGALAGGQWEYLDYYQGLIKLKLAILGNSQSQTRISESLVDQIYTLEVQKLECFLRQIRLSLKFPKSDKSKQEELQMATNIFRQHSQRLIEYEQRFPNINSYWVQKGQLVLCKIRAQLGLEVSYGSLEKLHQNTKFEDIRLEAVYLLVYLLQKKKSPQFYLQGVELIAKALLGSSSTSDYKHKALVLLSCMLRSMWQFQKSDDNRPDGSKKFMTSLGMQAMKPGSNKDTQNQNNKPLPPQSLSAGQISQAEYVDAKAEDLVNLTRQLRNLSTYFSPQRAVIVLIESALTPFVETLLTGLKPYLQTARVIRLSNFMGEQRVVTPQTILNEVNPFYNYDSTKTRGTTSTSFKNIESRYHNYSKYVIVLMPEANLNSHENKSDKASQANMNNNNKLNASDEMEAHANPYIKVMLIGNIAQSKRTKIFKECQKVYEMLLVDTVSFDQASYRQQLQLLFS